MTAGRGSPSTGPRAARTPSAGCPSSAIYNGGWAAPADTSLFQNGYCFTPGGGHFSSCVRRRPYPAIAAAAAVHPFRTHPQPPPPTLPPSPSPPGFCPDLPCAGRTCAGWQSYTCTTVTQVLGCTACAQCCGTPPPPPPSPSPPPPAPQPPAMSEWWSITSGTQYCQLTQNGMCVTDGVGAYGNNERCTVMARRDLFVTATEYTVESCCDYITIGSTIFRGSGNGPNALYMLNGATFS